MQPEEIEVEPAPAPLEVLTSGNGTVVVVSSPPEPAPVAASEADGGPVAAAMALVVLMAGIGKKLQMIMQAGHESRMEQAAREATLRAEEAQAEAQRAAQAVEDARIKAVAEASAKAENGGPGEAGDSSDEATACACEENQAAIDDLTRRLKVLEAWKKKKKLV